MKAIEPDLNTDQITGHYKKHIDKTYIGSYDLMLEDGSYRSVDVTIKATYRRSIYNPGKKEFQHKVIAAFETGSKLFIVNDTNYEAIQSITGTSSVDKWIGARIKLTVAEVSVGPQKKPAIRVKPPTKEK